MIHARIGLTLFELLAAVVILSAVTAAGVRLTLESRAAAESVKLRFDAIAALERWRAVSSDSDTGDWGWTDEFGRTWIVRTDEPASAPTAPEAIIQVRSQMIEVMLDRDGAVELILTIDSVTPVESESASVISEVTTS